MPRDLERRAADSASDAASRFSRYVARASLRPLFLRGDCVRVLGQLPPASVDCVLTSPPYWGHREYAGGGIGQESTFEEYIQHLVAVFREVHRVLKPTGSAWLNIGDSYQNKNLVGVPWRAALALTDTVGFTLRNDVIWHKVKGGPDNADDKLRNVHEHVFHFTKQARGYHYDVDAIRTTPKTAKVVNGAVVSATGVTGVRYARQIELSTELTEAEKTKAREALERILDEIRADKLADFRMVIRGQQRTTHSNSEKVSGRAKELQQKGFYFLKYHPNGAKPSDVWNIIPEDTQGRQSHFAPFPKDLCRIPIAATCPPGAIVLDPFCGTGTAMLVAMQMGRKSVGIDTSAEYLTVADERCALLL
jgi:DNA modification methylase